MYCQNCGKEIDDKATVCVYCGTPVNRRPKINDEGGFGWDF